MTHRGEPRAAWGRSRGSLAALGASLFISLTVVAVLVLSGGVFSGDGADDRSSAATGPPASAGGSGVATAATAAKAGLRTGAVDPEPPRSARLPSGQVVPVVPVDTTSDGTLDVPGDITVAGWWRGGSRIGDPFGSTLLSAHVDSSTQGLGPYAELLSVRPGESIVVTSKNLRQVFTVASLELVDKGTLSDHPVIFSPSGAHRLTLVTCAGPYVSSRGGYQRLAVVTASPDGPPVQLEG